MPEFNPLERLQQLFGSTDNYDYEAIGPLTPDDREEWEKITRGLREVEFTKMALNARKDLFWSRIRAMSDGDLLDRMSLKIEDGVLFASKERG